MTQIPKYTDLLEPLFAALKKLGGSGSLEEIDDTVAEILAIPEELLNIPHNSQRSSQSEFQYQMAWARTYLKKFGLIDNSVRGVWSIVPAQSHVNHIDPITIVRTVREASRAERVINQPEVELGNSEEELPEEVRTWRDTLHQVLTQEIDPSAFERLIQRLLRESGFVNVEVTGKTGDKGIDGKGIARINGILSFHVMFQCKRYQGAVTASEIRDFRGALVGRAEKGLFITTGRFTTGATEEATREGAPPIDLINGNDLADKLKELKLGIKTELVEHVTVEEEWYRAI